MDWLPLLNLFMGGLACGMLLLRIPYNALREKSDKYKRFAACTAMMVDYLQKELRESKEAYTKAANITESDKQFIVDATTQIAEINAQVDSLIKKVGV